jgi:hypothetical protein
MELCREQLTLSIASVTSVILGEITDITHAMLELCQVANIKDCVGAVALASTVFKLIEQEDALGATS